MKKNKENTTMKKNILSMAALLMASAAVFTACSSDDNITSEQPANPTGKYTMTVQASKGGDATTRALSLEGKTLNATWAITENVYVKKGDTWADGSLQPQADGATATLKGSLSGIEINAYDELTLQFPKSGDISYTGQVGTLEDIAANFDYATATVTVASVSASGNIVPTAATTTFENQQAIVKFTLIDKADGTTPLSASQLVISVGATDYTITASETSEIYAAIPGFSGQTVTLTATVGSDTYTYEKSGVSFTNGQYYEITVKMAKVPVTNLSTLPDGDYEAHDGEILTGTLGSNVKISIADGATVTLKDVNITNLGKNCDWAGINCPGDATLVLEGTNEVCPGKDYDGDSNYPGIYIAPDKTLIIQGDGTLTAYSNASKQMGAGIGGGYNRFPCGNITINGGTITATGGEWAAGIGGGGMASCGNITINGGTITATGGEWAAGIGSGFLASCGNITITSGVNSVTATKGSDADNSIGAGNSGSCGTVTIEDPSKVTQN